MKIKINLCLTNYEMSTSIFKTIYQIFQKSILSFVNNMLLSTIKVFYLELLITRLQDWKHFGSFIERSINFSLVHF